MNELQEAINNIIKYQKIIWEESGIKITTPGAIKELIISEKLYHKCLRTKHNADACSKHDENELYEYLCCEEGGSFQMDRMYGIGKTEKQQENSKHRVMRNKYFYHVTWFKDSLCIKSVYEIDSKIVWEYINEKLQNKANKSNHISINMKWTEENGKLVYEGKI